MAKWKGKAIGAGLGFLFGGPFGAILGTITGDFFDKTTLKQISTGGALKQSGKILKFRNTLSRNTYINCQSRWTRKHTGN